MRIKGKETLPTNQETLILRKRNSMKIQHKASGRTNGSNAEQNGINTDRSGTKSKKMKNGIKKNKKEVKNKKLHLRMIPKEKK